jgi:hypothetical protein
MDDLDIITGFPSALESGVGIDDVSDGSCGAERPGHTLLS